MLVAQREGALLVNGQVVAHYNSVAASLGLQVGRLSVTGWPAYAGLAGSHSSIGLPSGSCSLANRP
jgi:hypothetical protein